MTSTLTGTPAESVSGTLAAALRRSAQIEALIGEDAGRMRILTGDRPTGYLHLGHYFGTLRNRVRLQDAGAEVLVLVADYQVLTDRDSAQRLDDHVLGLVLDYLAIGIDPARSVIFAHSAVPELNQLLLPFLSLVTLPELQRNPTVKDEIGDGGAAALKRVVTEAVNERFAPVRARRAELAADPGYARAVLRDGCARARAIAGQTLAEVRAAMGMRY